MGGGWWRGRALAPSRARCYGEQRTGSGPLAVAGISGAADEGCSGWRKVVTRMWQEPLSGHQPSPWASPPLVPTTRPRGAIPVLMTDYGLSTGSGGSAPDHLPAAG